MREKEIINDLTKENRLFDGNGEYYGIYQLKESEERTYQFMGMREAGSLGFEIHGEDYDLIYSDQLAVEDTLDSLYEKFNINHPQDFTGHSLSVSDVVVIRRSGESKAYYVDSFGFTELPEFIHERLHLQEVSNSQDVKETAEEKGAQKKYPPVYQQTLPYAMEHGEADAYLDSRKLNVDCKKAIEETIKEHFDGMHLSLEDSGGVLTQFGAERVSYVLVNTLQHLSEDGRFSRENRAWADRIEVGENIHGGRDMNLDYLINSHPAVLDGYIHLVRGEIRMLDIEEKMEIPHVTMQTSGLTVEGHMGTWHTIGQQEYHGELFFLMRHDEYGNEVADIIVSENGTLVAEDLRNGFDVEAGLAISEYLEGNGASVYDLMELPAGAAIILYDGKELYTDKAQPIIQDSWDYSMTGIDENGEEYRFNFNEIHSVATEKGLQLKMPELHYIDHYYVVEDLQKQGGLDIWKYDSLSDALEDYFTLPNHKMKALGIQNQLPLPGTLDFIQCKNGIDHLTEDWKKTAGWLNPQIFQTVQYLKESLEVHETQIAYDTGIGFFAIQHTEGGYDYTFYDKDYLEKDGGVYDDPEFTIEEAASDLLSEEGIAIHDCKIMDYEELMESVENAEMEQQAERLHDVGLTGDTSALSGWNREEVETAVLENAQACLEEMELSQEVTLIGARVYGSRTREGLYRENSDIDVALSYSGNISEDSFFNVMHEAMKDINGITVDVNPISVEKTGTLETYMKKAEQYLDEKEMEKLAIDLDAFAYDHDPYEYRDSVENREESIQEIKKNIGQGNTEYLKEWLKDVVAESENPEEQKEAELLLARLDEIQKKITERQPEPALTYYVAECMEFSGLGEYHADLTINDAFEIYRRIPSDRMNGGKGIGIDLQEDSLYAGEYPLMCSNRIDMETLEGIPYMKDHPLVQQAVHAMEQRGVKLWYPIKEAQAVKQAEQRKEQPQRESKKESILKALKERQERLKAQQTEQKRTDRSQSKKKGDMEL